MESLMLKRLKSQNPDKEYPSNTRQKWNDAEEELSKNMDIKTIPQNHINFKRREIDYKMYLINNSIATEIIEKTRLDEDCIKQTIDKRKMTETKNHISLECEFAEMKNDIKELKNTIKELVEMMKTVYEFKDA